MAKYIVDLPKEYTSKSSLFGEILSVPIQINDGKNYNIPTAIKITPYTETDGVKNNKVNLCDSCNYIYPECPSERYDVMFGDGVGKDNICCCAGYRAINEQEIRQKVEDEVWEFARTVRRMSISDWGKCFELYTLAGIFDLNYSEAKAKYDAWRKQKDEIRVGCEVYHKELPELKIYVTDMADNSFGGFALCRVEGVCDYGDRFSECNVHQYKPTGRVLPNIVDLLKKMKEE